MNTKEAVRRACKSQRAALSVADCNTWTSMLTEQIVNNLLNINQPIALWPIWRCPRRPI